MKVYRDSMITLYNAPYQSILDDLGLVDHCITDPPYSSKVHTNAKRAYKGGIQPFITFDCFTHDDITTAFWWFGQHVKQWCIAFMDDSHVSGIKQRCEEAAYYPFKFVRKAIWHKPNTAPHVNQDREQMGYEEIAKLHQREHKGKYQWHGREYGRNHAVYSHPFIARRRTFGHPTKKPPALIRELILLHTSEGETIFDPFCGSGTVLQVARELGRRAIGCEVREDYFDLAVRELQREGWMYGTA